MKQLVAFLILVCFFCPDLPAESHLVELRPAGGGAVEIEKLVFLIRWGMVHGGYATLEIEGAQLCLDIPKECLLITSRARSNKFFDKFYKVRDTNKSWVDPVEFFSYGFEKDQNEGKFKRYRKVFFDYPNNKITVKSLDAVRERENHNQKLQDVLSALYFLRRQKINMDSSYSFAVATENKNFDMNIKVMGRENVEVEAGKFDCIKVKPELEEDGIFKAKGDVYVWLTDDDKHMPVLMKSKIVLGSITAELLSVSQTDFDALF